LRQPSGVGSAANAAIAWLLFSPALSSSLLLLRATKQEERCARVLLLLLCRARLRAQMRRACTTAMLTRPA